MTEFRRKGHFRTNSQGTTSWVSEHSVHKVVYTVSKKNNQIFVNNNRLLPSYCKYCYQRVFFISLNDKSNVLFNSDQEPLILHNCRKETNQTKKIEKTLPARRFLEGDNLAALERRAEEQKFRKEEKERKREKNRKSNSQKNVTERLRAASYAMKTLEKKFDNSDLVDFFPQALLVTGKELLTLTAKTESKKLTAKQHGKCIGPSVNLLHNLKLFLENNGDPNDLRRQTLVEMSVNLRKIVEGFSEQQRRLTEVQKALAHAEKLKVREFKKEQSRRESNQRKRAKKAAETVEISFKTKKKFPSK